MGSSIRLPDEVIVELITNNHGNRDNYIQRLLNLYDLFSIVDNLRVWIPVLLSCEREVLHNLISLFFAIKPSIMLQHTVIPNVLTRWRRQALFAALPADFWRDISRNDDILISILRVFPRCGRARRAFLETLGIEFLLERRSKFWQSEYILDCLSIFHRCTPDQERRMLLKTSDGDDLYMPEDMFNAYATFLRNHSRKGDVIYWLESEQFKSETIKESFPDVSARHIFVRKWFEWINEHYCGFWEEYRGESLDMLAYYSEDQQRRILARIFYGQMPEEIVSELITNSHNKRDTYSKKLINLPFTYVTTPPSQQHFMDLLNCPEEVLVTLYSGRNDLTIKESEALIDALPAAWWSAIRSGDSMLFRYIWHTLPEGYPLIALFRKLGPNFSSQVEVDNLHTGGPAPWRSLYVFSCFSAPKQKDLLLQIFTGCLSKELILEIITSTGDIQERYINKLLLLGPLLYWCLRSLKEVSSTQWRVYLPNLLNCSEDTLKGLFDLVKTMRRADSTCNPLTEGQVRELLEVLPAEFWHTIIRDEDDLFKIQRCFATPQSRGIFLQTLGSDFLRSLEISGWGEVSCLLPADLELEALIPPLVPAGYPHSFFTPDRVQATEGDGRIIDTDEFDALFN